MPLIYSKATTSIYSPVAVGTYRFPKPQPFSLVALIRALIILGEIALSFIPFISPFGQIAIGLAGGVALTAIDISQGYFNAINTLINFSGVAISAGFAIRSGIKISRNVKFLEASTRAQLELFARSAGRIAGRSARTANLQRTLKDLSLINKRLSVFENNVSLFKKLKILEKQGRLSTLVKFSKDFKRATSASSQLLNKIKSVNKANALSKSETDFVNRVVEQSQQIGKVFKGDQLKLYQQILDPRTRPSDLRNLIKGLINTLTPKQIALINVYTTNFKTFLKGASRPLSLRESGLKKLIRYMGTSRYNDKVVQRVQNLDPNNFGRYLVERPYQFAKRQIEKFNIK